MKSEVDEEQNTAGVATETPAWQPISSAPKNATEIEARFTDGVTLTAHWAEDLSGEEQPAFRGWFTAVKNAEGKTIGFQEIKTPAMWRPLAPKPDANSFVLGGEAQNTAVPSGKNQELEK